MSIKQNGGVFGRNPTFNDVTIEGDLIINGEVFTGLDFQGSWNASTNSPALASSVGTNGEFYIVSVAGATDLNGITNWGIGDWAIFNGTAWQRVEGGADGNFNDVTVAGTLGVAGDYSSTTLGTSNLRLGVNAGNSILAGGNYNTVIGDEAGTSITTGVRNVAVGAFALDTNSTGVQNVSVGYGAMDANTTGSYNTALGDAALASNDTASNNTAVGDDALKFNTTGYDNTAVGSGAGKSISTGIRNTAIGRLALQGTTTGSLNISIGYNANATSDSAGGQCTLGDANISNLRCNDQSISALSDSRDKTDVIDSPYGLDFINTVRPVQFKWESRDGNAKDGSTRIGFLAQELLAATDGNNAVLDLVLDDNPEKLEAKYGNLLPIAIQAIQELSAQVDALTARIETLEGQ